ncbi:protein-glutamate O-methyltransferase CheR [candidate division KSB1 bacterium]|nr:protein-glutamate O-methyltransferase CheR [candidate division KSB1 bacterium]
MNFSENQAFLALQKRLFNERGLDFSQYRKQHFKRRIDVRLSATKAQTYLEYMNVLKKDPSEYDRLFNALTINVTRFFRDAETFEVIKDDVLRKIISSKRNRNKKLIRIWSAGCASGEEPYSIAILFNEILGSQINDFFISIYATDIDENSLQKGRTAEYDNNSILDVESTILRRYFRNNGNYELKERIKEMVEFKYNDLVLNEPLARLDVIVCRNVLIYFSIELQRKIFNNFYQGLNRGGYLVLGKTETLTGKPASMFQQVNIQEKIYQKI